MNRCIRKSFVCYLGLTSLLFINPSKTHSTARKLFNEERFCLVEILKKNIIIYLADFNPQQDEEENYNIKSVFYLITFETTSFT